MKKGKKTQSVDTLELRDGWLKRAFIAAKRRRISDPKWSIGLSSVTFGQPKRGMEV